MAQILPVLFVLILKLLNYPTPHFCVRSNTMLEYIYKLKVAQRIQKYPFLGGQFISFYLVKGILYTYLVTVTLRAALMRHILSYEPEFLAQYVHFDPLMTTGISMFNFLDQRTILPTGLLALFALYMDYSMVFQSDYFITGMQHEINIDNIEDIISLNPEVFKWPAISVLAPTQSAMAVFELLKSIWNCDNLKFKKSQLNCFPNISRKLRARVMVFSLALEFIFMLIILLTGLFVIIFFLLHLYVISFNLPLSTMAIAFVDGIFMGYGAWNAVRFGFFSIHVIAMLAFISNQHVNEINQSIKEAMKGTSQLVLKIRLDFFRREHRHIQFLAKYVNDLVSSKLLLVTFLTNIYLNIMFISKLIFQSMLLAEQAVIVLIIIAQTIISVQGCVALIIWANSLYKSSRLLYLAQAFLDNKEASFWGTLMLVAKLKLMLYYEMVCTAAEFRFTMGQLGSISKKSLYEFLFVYTGFILYTSKIVIKSRNNAKFEVGLTEMPPPITIPSLKDMFG